MTTHLPTDPELRAKLRAALNAKPSIDWLRPFGVPVGGMPQQDRERKAWLRKHLPGIWQRCQGDYCAVGAELQRRGFYSRKSAIWASLHTIAHELGLIWKHEEEAA